MLFKLVLWYTYICIHRGGLYKKLGTCTSVYPLSLHIFNSVSSCHQGIPIAIIMFDMLLNIFLVVHLGVYWERMVGYV